MIKNGFTLIEVIIVIVILGVLATLALPRITGNLETARAAEVMTMFGALRRASVDCLDMNNRTKSGCDTWGELNMVAPAETNFTYTVNTANATLITFMAERNSVVGGFICMQIDTSSGRAVFSFVGQSFQSIIARTANVGSWVCTSGVAL
jgi:prepilin-type N-terminal cleavage/methylation domain-containing protein